MALFYFHEEVGETIMVLGHPRSNRNRRRETSARMVDFNLFSYFHIGYNEGK